MHTEADLSVLVPLLRGPSGAPGPQPVVGEVRGFLLEPGFRRARGADPMKASIIERASRPPTKSRRA